MLMTALAAGLGATLLAPPAAAQAVRVPEGQSARLLRGTITGIVNDERGAPLPGATVSAVGQQFASAVTDERGAFALSSLPAGEYVLQAHMSGFTGSRRETVHVGAGFSAHQRFFLRRLESAVGTSGTGPVLARPIIAAGFALPSGTLTDEEDGKGEHPHTETAWRQRHLKRSILKDSTSIVTLVDRDPEIDRGSLFGRAMFDSAATLAAFFTDLPFSGEVNVLTTGALGPGDALFSGEIFPRSVAYVSIGSPTPAGDWALRAAMGQGDLASWVISGAFSSRGDGAHRYDFGLTYSEQEYLGGNPAALAGVKDGSRNVGEVFAYDRWVVGPRVELEFGGRYARHGYLPDRGLMSPTFGVSVSPLEKIWVTASFAQHMVAPGAEEFLASELPGPWLPPERTFAPLGGEDAAFRVERALSYDLGIEREFAGTYAIGLRRFHQDIDDQLVTLFGLTLPGGPQSVGHYYVASAGGVDADGWAFRIRTPEQRRLSASVDYSVTRARWSGEPDRDIVRYAPAAVRTIERVHDVTTRVTTEIPETATRVFVLYKINNAYTRSNTALPLPGLDARFDVQVNQALPFGVGGTTWEVLVGVRNLFRDPDHPGSIYDELLVARPPKRVVGGFLVRF
jgi:hypothetical protein